MLASCPPYHLRLPSMCDLQSSHLVCDVSCVHMWPRSSAPLALCITGRVRGELTAPGLHGEVG